MDWDGMMETVQNDLTKIKKDAEAAQTCLERGAHSPGAVDRLRTQLDETAGELLTSQQLLTVKTKGVFTHFDLTISNRA